MRFPISFTAIFSLLATIGLLVAISIFADRLRPGESEITTGPRQDSHSSPGPAQVSPPEEAIETMSP